VICEADQAADYVASLLIEALEDSDEEVLWYAGKALLNLAALRSNIVPAMCSVIAGRLKDPAVGVRRSAAKVLSEAGQAADCVAPLLIESLKDTDSQVLNYAGVALLNIGTEESLEAVLQQPRPSFEGLRIVALHRFILLGKKLSVEPLIHSLGGNVPEIQEYAALALYDVGDATAVPAILPLLEEDWSHLSDPYTPGLTPQGKIVLVAGAAARALGRLGDETTVPALIKAVENRAAAEEAVKALKQILGRCAEKIGSDQLRELARLGAVEQVNDVVERDEHGCVTWWECMCEWVSCEDLKRLAQAELRHRGSARKKAT
jgi:HEAT repeat protein